MEEMDVVSVVLGELIRRRDWLVGFSGQFGGGKQDEIGCNFKELACNFKELALKVFVERGEVVRVFGAVLS